MKIKLKLVVDQALHFYKWEQPFFNKEFELVDSPGDDVVVLAFGPDVLERAAEMPALKRVALLFPGFGFNPYHNPETKKKVIDLIERKYDAVLVNPGPVEEALKETRKTYCHPFSINVDQILKYKKIRKNLNSLIHVSANAPQKDWERSRAVMELSGLKYEVFPPRSSAVGEDSRKGTWSERLSWRYNKYITTRISPHTAFIRQNGYVSHKHIIKKYLEYDGFIHIASEKNLPQHLDGKYTASLFEAGLSGSIVFWHDTFNLGNDFETVFSVSKDPQVAANEIKEIRANLDIERHSKMTSEEIAERCEPRSIVEFRRQVIESLLD